MTMAVAVSVAYPIKQYDYSYNNLKNIMEPNGMLPRGLTDKDVCNRNYVMDSCWITDFGIMTSTSCCYVSNSSQFMVATKGRVKECYKFKESHGDFHVATNKIAKGCLFYMDCHAFTQEEIDRMIEEKYTKDITEYMHKMFDQNKDKGNFPKKQNWYELFIMLKKKIPASCVVSFSMLNAGLILIKAQLFPNSSTFDIMLSVSIFVNILMFLLSIKI